MRTPLLSILAAFLLVLTAGCVSSKMQRAPDGTTYAPEPGKALIVFLRPSSLGGGVQSSVYDVSSPDTDFIAIVSSGTKVAYQSPPGERQFMVVSEAGDFLHASLDEGKTYYVLVTPRFGVWRARFSLKAVHADMIQSGQLKGWDHGTTWYVNTDASRAWAQDNRRDILSKRAEYLPKWNEKSDDDKRTFTLLRSDGQ